MTSPPHSKSRVSSPDSIDLRQLDLISFYSLLGGATALIPIPFLDELILQALKRSMAAKLIRGHHPDTSAEAIRELVDEQSLFVRKGCIYTTFFYLVILPVKFVGFLIARLFRTILFFLAIKFVSDRASEVFHWGYLIAYSATRMAEAPPLSLHKARVLRQAIESSLEELNTSPVYGIFTRIIRFNKQILSEAARVLRRSGRQVRPGSPGSSADFRMKEMLGEERSLLEKLAHQLADLLGGEQDYLKSIEARMDAQARKLGLF